MHDSELTRAFVFEPVDFRSIADAELRAVDRREETSSFAGIFECRRRNSGFKFVVPI